MCNFQWNLKKYPKYYYEKYHSKKQTNYHWNWWIQKHNWTINYHSNINLFLLYSQEMNEYSEWIFWKYSENIGLIDWVSSVGVKRSTPHPSLVQISLKKGRKKTRNTEKYHKLNWIDPHTRQKMYSISNWQLFKDNKIVSSFSNHFFQNDFIVIIPCWYKCWNFFPFFSFLLIRFFSSDEDVTWWDDDLWPYNRHGMMVKTDE